MTQHPPQSGEQSEAARSIADEKSALRKSVRESVRAIAPFRAAWRARRICGLALRAPALSGARLVLAYRALPDEVDIAELVGPLVARGVRVAFPAVDARGTLLLVEPAGHRDGAAWFRDRFGVDAPRAEAAGARSVHPREVDAVLVPGRAFARDGARLGRGKGFYDALLARLRPDARRATLGVCYREQLVDRVPEAAHDARVAAVVTDAGFVACLAQGRRPATGHPAAAERKEP